MSKPVAITTLVLALITGAWFGQAYSLFAPINLVQTEDTAVKAAVSTVWRYYDAVDILFRTADDSALLAVIAPDFIDHVDEPGVPSDRDGLVRYLASLRETYPNLRLVPQEVVAQEDRVVARLAPFDEAGGAILGVPLAGNEPWPHVDMVRVEGSRIVERWGDPAGYGVATTLISETLTFSHQQALVPWLRRVTLDPGVGDGSFRQRGAAIISVEFGQVEVTATGGNPSSSVLTARDTLRFAEDDGLVITNRSDALAVFLVFTFEQLVPQNLQSRATEVAFETITGTTGVTIQTLVGTTAATANPGRLSINLARVTLMPGARLALHQAAGLESVATEAGSVTAFVAGEHSSAWLMDPRGHTVAPASSAQLTAEFSLTVAKGASTTYANETAQAVTLLLLTVTPE